jgi:hypothetical protein
VGAPRVSEQSRRLVQALIANPTFKTQLPGEPRRSAIVAALEYLMDTSGQIPEAAFASALGMAQSRVSGFVATLGRVVNCEGYAVVLFDPADRFVRFERETLIQYFGLQS